MNVILSHPTGNQNVRAIMNALYRHDMLLRFNTTLSIDSKNLLLKLLPGSIHNELSRRFFSIPSRRIKTTPFREIARIGLPKFGFTNIVRHEHGWASIDAVYQNMDKSVSSYLRKINTGHNVEAVYCYEDGAMHTFTVAKQLGIKCIYDLPIAFWETGRRLMEEEASRLPAWAKTLGGGTQDSAAKLERKSKEMELADIVVTPSQFVADSLPGSTGEKLKIVAPFGSPKSFEKKESANDHDQADKPLRVLFIGSLSQRKGLGDLFQAIKLLKRQDVELVVLGSLQAPLEFYRNEYAHFTYLEGRPHAQVLELMRSCDVFCLPSIVEGRALVMQEAMSQGLPLIITPNTGGKDLIEEGKTGFLVPIRSPENIATRIAWFAEHRRETKQMGENAKQLAQKYSWENYGDMIIENIKRLYN